MQANRARGAGVTRLLFVAVLLTGCGDGAEPSTPKCTKKVDIVCTVVDGLRSCRATPVCR